ncbi:MAG: glycoside hydrolase family 16 protein [Planctomycetota bacterium]
MRYGTWRLLCLGLLPTLAWGQSPVSPPATRAEATPQEAAARSPYVPPGYELSFQDEFDALQLDTRATGKGWQTYFPWTDACPGFNVRYFADNADQQLWVDPDYNVEGKRLKMPVHLLTADGTVQLLAKPVPSQKLQLTQGFRYVGAAMTTQCRFWQQFGYFEARLRFRFGQGQHWAFWMLPKNPEHPHLELDIVERVGIKGERSRVYQNSHGEPTDISFVEVDGNEEDWITYGLEWNEEEITWFVDGEPTRRVKNYIWEPMYLIICCEIGNSWVGDPDESTPWPTVAEVDYVRAYQKPKD